MERTHHLYAGYIVCSERPLPASGEVEVAALKALRDNGEMPGEA